MSFNSDAPVAPEMPVEPEADVLLQVKNLTRHFGSSSQPVRAVEDVSFDVRRGRTLALVGESGSGKSTIGRCVLRLIEPTAGDVLYEQQSLPALSAAEMRKMRSKMQIIFQDPQASLNPRMRVSTMLGEILDAHGLAKGALRGPRIAELLQLVGLPADAGQRFSHEFSGGQKQRVGIARALAVNPCLIVADEPLSALDVSIQAQIVNLLAELRKTRDLTLLFISHDLDVVEYLCDDVVVLYLGRVMESGPVRQIFDSPSHPYTRALLEAAPVPDPAMPAPRATLSGELPSPMNPPSGCVFRTRCPQVMPHCSEAVPPMFAVAPGQHSACWLHQDAPTSTPAL